MTAAQIAAITNPAVGLIVFNTSTNCLQFNTTGTTTGWNDISCGCTGTPGAPGIISPANPSSANVCESQTGQTFSVSLVPNATSYNWTVPSEVGTWTGQGGPVITVLTYTNTVTSTGTYSVTASNACGVSSASTFTATVYSGNPAGTITSGYPISICSTGSNIMSLTGAANYQTITWSAPASITSAANVTAANLANATSLTLSGGTGGTGQVSVTLSNPCGNTLLTSSNITDYSGNPAGSITAGYPTAACHITANTITLTGAANYQTITWSAPTSITTAANVTAAQNTTGLTLSGGTGGTGQVSVTLSNPCGSTPLTSSPITIYVGNPTGTITTGYPTIICNSATNTMTLTGAANYETITWSALPSITTAAQVAAAQNTTSLILKGGTGGSGAISVTLANSCGAILIYSSVIYCYAGNPMGSIAAGYPTAACITATNTITLTGVSNNQTITWSAPTSITSAAHVTAAQNTTSLTLAGGTGGTGQVSVTLTNLCGSTPLTSSNITISTPGNPTGSIASGYLTNTCNATANIISLTGATNYSTITWSAPASITAPANVTAAQNTTSLTLVGGTGGTAPATVTLANACGGSIGPLSTTNITVFTIGNHGGPTTYVWNGGTTTTSIGYYAGTKQVWVVPDCVNLITVTLTGGSGGAGNGTTGGLGAVVTGTIAVVSGQTLIIEVGGQGLPGTPCGGGGGASYLWDGTSVVLLAVAGGGGGGGQFGLRGANAQIDITSVAAFEAAKSAGASDPPGLGGGPISGGTSDASGGSGGAGWGENGALPTTVNAGMTIAYKPKSVITTGYGGLGYVSGGPGGYCGGGGAGFTGAGGGAGYNGGGGGLGGGIYGGGGGGAGYFSSDGGTTPSVPISAAVGTANTNGSVVITY